MQIFQYQAPLDLKNQNQNLKSNFDFKTPQFFELGPSPKGWTPSFSWDHTDRRSRRNRRSVGPTRRRPGGSPDPTGVRGL